MKSIFYIHFNEQELLERIEPLKEAGYTVGKHFSTEKAVKFTDNWPDIFVLSLECLPSHAKAYAQWIWEAKKRQHIAIVFVDGKDEKVEAMKELFPRAHFCNSKNLPGVLKKIAA